MIDYESLCCPACKTELKEIEKAYICCNVSCAHSLTENQFIIVDSCPVLISDILCDTVCDSQNINSYMLRLSHDSAFNKIKSWVRGASKVTIKNCDKFVSNLKKKSKNPMKYL